MSILLYELVGRGDRRFSPYCWRAVMALAHKRLEARRLPVKFTDKEKIAFSGQKLVPVLVDGETTVADSWAIACHLEDSYPDRPSLFGGPQARGLALFLNDWVVLALHPAMMRIIIGDVFASVHADDRTYFRDTREARFGMKIEALHESRADHTEAVKRALAPLQATVAGQPFLSGAAPAYGDYIVFGALQWARITSPRPLIDSDSPLHAWRERMLDLHDGHARAAPAALDLNP